MMFSTPRGESSRPAGSGQVVTPADGFAVPIGHDPVKLAAGGLENEWKEMAVAFPQRQIGDAFQGDPFEGAFRVDCDGCALPLVDEENETEPVFTVFAEPGPADGATQDQVGTLQS